MAHLVERLKAGDGETVALQPLLFVDGENVIDGDGLSEVTVQARILAHERGPKLRIVKFKPKRGYKRRTGHRQELTRIEVTEIRAGGSGAGSGSGSGSGSGGSRRGGGRAAAEPAPVAAAPANAPAPATESAQENTEAENGS